MEIEFERKFLLKDQSWRTSVVRTRRLCDGLIAESENSKVRVRVEKPQVWLTVKGLQIGIGRLEAEYEIPLADAERMLREICGPNVVEKMRHLIPYDGLTWEVDVYTGRLEGISCAEIELSSAHCPVRLPPWVGKEVTGDPHYGKWELLRSRLATQVPAK